MKIGIVGVGYWGHKYVRIFSQMRETTKVWVFDQSFERATEVAKWYAPLSEAWSGNFNKLVAECDAIVIATPATQHFYQAEHALKKGKHVLCEKPVALSAAEHLHLRELAHQQRRILFPGLTFHYHPVIRAIYNNYFLFENMLDKPLQDRPWGRPVYFRSQRTNMGPVRQDVSALMDLAPHDISIASLFFGTPRIDHVHEYPIWGTNRDGGTLNLSFWGKNGHVVDGSIAVSWSEPQKVRLMRIVFEHMMLEFDDTDQAHPLRMYDLKEGPETSTVIPVTDSEEPLVKMCRDFRISMNLGYAPDALMKASQDVSAVMGGLSRPNLD